MNKLIIALSVACASACVFADGGENTPSPTQDQYGSWFKAIGTNPTVENNLDTTDGDWTLTNEGVSVDGEKNLVLELDMEAGTEVSFAPTATAPDQNTITRVVTTAVIGSVDAEALQPLTGAQAAFAATESNYVAWLGGDSWVALDGVAPDAEKQIALTTEIKYLGESTADNKIREIRFTVDETILKDTNGKEWLTLSGAADKDALGSIAFRGAGKIAALGSKVMQSVASVDGIKYGTLIAAQSVATEKGLPVVVNDDIDLPVNPTIDDDLKGGKSGTYVIDTGMTGGKVVVNLPEEVAKYKAMAGDPVQDGTKVTITLQTKKEILSAVQFGGKGLMNNEAAFREFLTNHGTKAAYEAAQANADDITTELAKTGDNKLALWQDYALGIEPDTSVKPVAIEKDTDADAITLAIPALATATPSGDYMIKYKVDNGTAGDAIKIPLETGDHNVKIVFE